MDQNMNNAINFDLPKNRSNVIKVIGVGGGGSNAINYMFQQGINGVDFIICNTDAQALAGSGVPTKIQLGASLTEGLGAGANPDVGEQAALESKEEIQGILSTQTKMIFITAGMGGGTGTGAAPIIAHMAKSMDILTVGIVTMPFQFEGKIRLDQAQKGLEKMRDAVDALIVINNNKLREVYGNLGFKAGFSKADEVLATAARGIAEVITHHYTQNIDLKDAKTVLTSSGTAIMGSASASGSNRAQEAIVKALDSPLLNDNKITGCKNVLLLIVSGSEEITIDEIGEINDYIQAEAGNHTNIIMGVGEDTTLGNAIAVTVIATGFGKEQQHEISNTEAKKIIHSLEDEQKIVHDLSEKLESSSTPLGLLFDEDDKLFNQQPIKSNTKLENPLIHMNSILYDIEIEYELVSNGNFSIPKENVLTDKEELDPFAMQVNEPITYETDLNQEDLKHEYVQKEIGNSFDVEQKQLLKDIELEAISLEVESLEESGIIENEENLEEEFIPIMETPLFSPEFENVTTTENEIKEDQFEEKGVFNETPFPSLEPQDDEFVFNEVTTSLFEMDVVDPEFIEVENQFEIDFEQPLASKSNSVSHEISIKQVTEPLLFDDEFKESANKIHVEIKKESNTTFVETKKTSNDKIKTESDDPFDQSIAMSMAAQNEKRKAHLKAFNYQFKHQIQRVDDMEREPAYKRQGVSLESQVPEVSSRLTLDVDQNEKIQLRSNNSFLHDNVD